MKLSFKNNYFGNTYAPTLYYSLDQLKNNEKAKKEIQQLNNDLNKLKDVKLALIENNEKLKKQNKTTFKKMSL